MKRVLVYTDALGKIDTLPDYEVKSVVRLSKAKALRFAIYTKGNELFPSETHFAQDAVWVITSGEEAGMVAEAGKGDCSH